MTLADLSPVTGASLKRRIDMILHARARGDLNPIRRFLLASGAVAAVACPLVIIGVGQAPLIRAQARTRSVSQPEFEVASVKVVDHSVPMHPHGLDISHGTLKIDAVPLRFIIGLAYAAQVQRGPDL